ncbi:hypothetical protein D9Q98_003838 [Chlorella vulgaris]|uniref:Protein kinase domain-containing protein n=1 Tax=Chlorella vulgaris TaxID=3077 RepID=A0A9D4YY22_CHLVU|nr:hypothetical protein D9Q98_003838 [Chlorella vulgaris]
MKLQFSQQNSQPTPSAQLGQGFKAMSLSSQQSAGGSASGTQSDKPPVPLFANGGPPVSSQQLPLGPQMEMPCLSQQEMLGTQDFITPVDQFGSQYDPKDAKRSPARLTPNRVKRPRQSSATDGGLDECGDPSGMRGGGAGPTGRCPAAAYGNGSGRRPMARVQSPPCYRNIFAGGEAEEDFAAWKAARPQQQALTRYRQDFKEIGLLGQGNFSKVFRVRHRFDGREYAVKRTQRAAAPDGPDFVRFIQEAQVMAHLPPHPNVVQYYSCWTEARQEGEHLYLQLEKCDVNLAIHSTLGEQLKEGDLLEVLRQMAAALAHLHRSGVAHMDVKPDNIYLQEPSEEEMAAAAAGGGGGDCGGTTCPGTRYKLGDFGQATRLDLQTPAAVDEGDSRYLPLEVLRGQLHQLAKADMFALGATLLELATRTELPAGGQQYADLRAGKLPLLPTCTQRFAAMLRALMSPNPQDRPSAERVLQSSLLARKQPGAPEQKQQQAEAKPALAHQASTAFTQSTMSAAGMESSGGGGSRQFAGLVLQRSTARG